MDDLSAAGDTDETAFWKEVHDYLMSRESVAANAKTVVLDDGETYNCDLGSANRNRENPHDP